MPRVNGNSPGQPVLSSASGGPYTGSTSSPDSVLKSASRLAAWSKRCCQRLRPASDSGISASKIVGRPTIFSVGAGGGWWGLGGTRGAGRTHHGPFGKKRGFSVQPMRHLRRLLRAQGSVHKDRGQPLRAEVARTY